MPSHQDEVPYIAIVEIDGEQRVWPVVGTPHKPTVEAHLKQIHPELVIHSLELADKDDPQGHVEWALRQHREANPDQEPLTQEKLTASAFAAQARIDAERDAARPAKFGTAPAPKVPAPGAAGTVASISHKTKA